MNNVALGESSSNSDRDKELMSGMESPLQQETAIPAPKRTRNNSMIPPQLLNDTGGGSRERAALATVFGVLEYSESKIFWERQSHDTVLLQKQQAYYGHSADKEENENLASLSHSRLSSTPMPVSSSSSPVSCKVSPNMTSSLSATTVKEKQDRSALNLLPDIPTVSRFNDILIQDENGSDIMFPANASSVLLHSSMMPVLERSVSNGSIHSSFTMQTTTALPDSIKAETGDPPRLSQDYRQVSAPLLFIGYPPAVFDLLKPDDDDRIIIWGPDPKVVSASMATTGHSLAKPISAIDSPAERPLLRGFSSNTTTSVTSTSVPTSGSITSHNSNQHRPRILSGKLTDGLRKTLRSHSLMHRSSTENLKSILLLKRTFGNSKLRQQQQKQIDTASLSDSTTSNSQVAKVIEAASVEKLVEKLTNTLDYEFMTDFFLTYRSFISPTQLCKLLILRFRWALENDDEERRIVRIRTFVVMRHWLLNYFVHDFIPIRDLRVVLTTFLNALPSHPLVRSSPRDQRIVKGLKRVVRRLKKVYYNGTNSQRVQVIAPPPPSSDQERVEEMVRANLAHGLLRRKTALVRGVDVGGKHNGNMAVQDARRAPMVVIGNVHNKTDFQQYQHHQASTCGETPLAPSDMSMASSRHTTTTSMDIVSRTFKENQSDAINSTKQSYLQRMEQERKSNVFSSIQDMHASASASQASVASDDSLESALSPGTTDIASDEDDYFDEDEGGTLNSEEGHYHNNETASSRQPWKSDYHYSKLEHERRRREEEEERKRQEFFSSPVNDKQSAFDDNKPLPSISDLYVSDSRLLLQSTLSSGSEDTTYNMPKDTAKNSTKSQGQVEVQTQHKTLAPLQEADVTQTITLPPSPPPPARTAAAAAAAAEEEGNDESLTTNAQNKVSKEGEERTAEHAATLALLERLDGPIRKAAIGDTSSRIRRVPSSRWCQVSPEEEGPTSHQRVTSSTLADTFPEELIRQLDMVDAASNDNLKRIVPCEHNQSLTLETKDDYDMTALVPINNMANAVGLSRHLSRKSIERRKSEKNLRDLAASEMGKNIRKSSSTPCSPHHQPAKVNTDIPEMPPMPEGVASDSLIIKSNALNDSTLLPKNIFVNNVSSNSSAVPTLHATKRKEDKDDFEAIPYDQTVLPVSTESSKSTSNSTTHRRGLSKKLVNMVFSRSPSTSDTSAITNDIFSNTCSGSSSSANGSKGGSNNTGNCDRKKSGTEKSSVKSKAVTVPIVSDATVTSSTKVQLEEDKDNQPIASLTRSPSIPTPVASLSSSSESSSESITPGKISSSLASTSPSPPQPIPSSTLVSRIAQELRESQNDFEIRCDCVRCTGLPTGPRACRRFSLALLTDDEKRHSLELRRRRGASIDKGKVNPLKLVSEKKTKQGDGGDDDSKVYLSRGPKYLGQLNASFSHSDPDLGGLHIEEIDETDGNGNDNSMTSSSASSLASSSGDSQHKQRIRHSEDIARDKKNQLNVSNKSLDRLTGISTKGDGTSLHRQTFSVTSIHSMDPSLPLQNVADDKSQGPLSFSMAPLASDRRSSMSAIPPWHPAPMNDEMMMAMMSEDITNTNTPTHYLQSLATSAATSSSFILSYRSGKMAKQLCFIERDVLLGVDWEEMVHCRWTKMATNATNETATRSSQQYDGNGDNDNDNDGGGCATNSCRSSAIPTHVNYTRQLRQMQLARQDGYGGIEQVIERFNTVCQWVASEIVSVQKLDLRVKVVEKFIRLAQKCRMYSNFATLVQILLGLQSPAVSRLKRTWSRVGASEMRLLDELSQFTSPMRNWKHIRDNMTMVADEYGMSPTEVQVEMPGTSSSGQKGFKRTKVKIPFGGCIPFLGIYLSDLVFNSEQPPYLEPNHAHHKIYKEQTATSQATLSPVLKQPLVNFRKHRITATVIKRVLTFQNLARRYAFDFDEEIYERCLMLDPLDGDTVRRLSHAIEP